MVEFWEFCMFYKRVPWPLGVLAPVDVLGQQLSCFSFLTLYLGPCFIKPCFGEPFLMVLTLMYYLVNDSIYSKEQGIFGENSWFKSRGENNGIFWVPIKWLLKIYLGIKKKPPGLPYDTKLVTLPDCSSVTSCMCVYVCDRHRDFERGTERKTGTKRDRERNNCREKGFVFFSYTIYFFLSLSMVLSC